MEAAELNTFEEFERKAKAVLEDHEKKRQARRGYFSPVLFRGQARASWELSTSLERYSTRPYSPGDYYKVVCNVRPAVESCTGKRWPFPDEYPGKDRGLPAGPKGYEFMVYLRHHGFPSPLLDWTQSFYVAAFFAFQSSKAADPDDPDVAIYALREYCGRGKSGWANEATIGSLGPYMTTDKRHVTQQCECTFCRKESGDRYLYCSHEEAFKRDERDQDVLLKFTIPRAERRKVLDELRMMNITAYSLFGGEESLMATLAYQEIESREFR